MSTAILAPIPSSYGSPLYEKIPNSLKKAVEQNLVPGERVLVQLKGAFNEVLVCTDRRMMIIKSGFMTGHAFGSDVFQLPYERIASAEVKFNLLSGYFQVSASGMQNTAKNCWSSEKGTNPQKAPNCISLFSKQQAATFRSACSFLMGNINSTRPVAVGTEPEISVALEKLWKLKTDGAINQAEYEAAKAHILTN
jgi:hypothetical protein